MTTRLRRGKVFTAVAGAAAVGALALAPHFVGAGLGGAFRALQGASRGWLALAVVLYAVGYLTMAGAWRTALAARGARLPVQEVLARLGLGSIVNTFAPARVGDAVKVALLSESLEGPDRVWTAGGLYTALAASRALPIAALVVVASATGALPVWPALALVGGVAAALALGLSPVRPARWHRLAHLLDGLAALAQSPREAAKVVAWSTGTTLARLAATSTLAAALGVHHPVLAGLVIVTALDVAGLMPLTPGNLGVASGAVAVALAARGIDATHAVEVGIAVQTLETLVSLSAGSFGLLYLARRRWPARPWAVRAIAVGSSLAIAAAGAIVFGLVST
ncbi:MAG TPA: YbhN family protein [Solirubrobacteraceae bacterium]|nr:YbhN family protein [Solirubrobacteraceae bacterium]